MRPIATAVVIATMLATVSAFSTAQAASPMKPWVAGYGSWSTYAMGDVNDGIDNFNVILAGGGLSMDKVQNGFAFGFELGADTPLLVFGIGYERLTGSTDVSAEGAKIEFNLPANSFYGLAEYKLPFSGPVGARLGLAAGLVSLAAQEKFTAVGEGTQTNDITGSGPLFKVYGSAEVHAATRVALLGSIGYRYAKVSEPSVDVPGTIIPISYLQELSPGFAVDYSGVFFRAGLKVALMP